MGRVVAAIDFDGEPDSLGDGEAATFFLSAADNPIGVNPNAAMHAAAISCDVCFIIVRFGSGIGTDPARWTRSGGFLFNASSESGRAMQSHFA